MYWSTSWNTPLSQCSFMADTRSRVAAREPLMHRSRSAFPYRLWRHASHSSSPQRKSYLPQNIKKSDMRCTTRTPSRLAAWMMEGERWFTSWRI